MRIGVNALYLIPGGVGGTEIYLRSLLRALAAEGSAHEFVVFGNRETEADLVPAEPNWHWRQLDLAATSRPGRLLSEQFRLPALCRKERVEVLLNPGFTAPFRPGCPQVTVFHDLQHKRHPENFRWFDLPAWRVFLWIAARRSQRIIAVSETTAQDLRKFYGLDGSRVAVVWSGVDERFFELRCTPGETGKVLLYASTTHPHKNHARLLRVFADLRNELPDWKLMLTGVRGFAEEEVRAEMRVLDLESEVVVTGWVPREQLYQLFRQAGAFIYPSTFEGFGMPVLEALAAGLPTACADIEPLKTLAGGAALLFDPRDGAAMRRAILQITSDAETRRRLSSAGPLQAARFSWADSARATLAVLEDVYRK